MTSVIITNDNYSIARSDNDNNGYYGSPLRGCICSFVSSSLRPATIAGDPIRRPMRV